MAAALQSENTVRAWVTVHFAIGLQDCFGLGFRVSFPSPSPSPSRLFQELRESVEWMGDRRRLP